MWQNNVMTRALAILAALVCSAFLAGAQQNFEVGTVKFSQPESSGPFSVIPVAPGVRNGLFDARHMTLKNLLAYAHDVAEVQIAGPAWLDKNHYTVAAQVPEATPLGEVRKMLRGFLAEHFKIATRSVTQEMEALALVVSEKGHKLLPIAPGETVNPNIPKGGGSLIVSRSDMRNWADFLTRVVGSPVIDRTGLQGRYAGAVMYLADNRLGDGLSEFPAFPVALKEQLGLELVKRKMTVDMVVVDTAQEVPEEN